MVKAFNQSSDSYRKYAEAVKENENLNLNGSKDKSVLWQALQ